MRIPLVYIFAAVLSCLILGVAAEEKCKPAIEADTPGYNYEKIVDSFLKAKAKRENAKINSRLQWRIDEVISQYGSLGLDGVMEEVRRLGLKWKN